MTLYGSASSISGVTAGITYYALSANPSPLYMITAMILGIAFGKITSVRSTK